MICRLILAVSRYGRHGRTVEHVRTCVVDSFHCMPLPRSTASATILYQYQILVSLVVVERTPVQRGQQETTLRCRWYTWRTQHDQTQRNLVRPPPSSTPPTPRLLISPVHTQSMPRFAGSPKNQILTLQSSWGRCYKAPSGPVRFSLSTRAHLTAIIRSDHTMLYTRTVSTGQATASCPRARQEF